MTKAEWDACASPDEMVRALPAEQFQRELRLFAVLAVRRVWSLLPAPCQFAVDVSEGFAAGAADEEELSRAVASADAAAQQVPPGGAAPDARGYATSAAVDASSIWPRTASNVLAATSCAASAIGCAAAESVDDSRYDAVFDAAYHAELVNQADLLRELVNPPFA